VKQVSVVIIGVVVLLVILLAACGPKAPPTPTPLTAAEIIEKSAEKMETLSSFHFELDQVGGGTPIAMGLEMTKAVGDVARPGKLKTTISATIAGMFLEVGIITVGETTYMTNPLTMQWEPLPSEFSAVALFNPDIGIKAIIKGVKNPTKLEDEEVAGIFCYHLKGTLDSSDLRPFVGSAALEGIPIGTEIWIGKDDFLLRQIKLEGRLTEAEKPGIIRTITLSKFDQPVTIELPE
jgi:lipoprotein LprG